MSGTPPPHTPNRTMHQLERRSAIRSVALLVGGLVGVGILLVLGTRVFSALRVRTVTCTYSAHDCPDALHEHIQPLKGAFIFRLPHLATTRAYTLKRTFPDHVDVNFTLSQLLLSFHTQEASESAYSLSTDGHIDRFETRSDQTISALDDELASYTDWTPVSKGVLDLYTAIMAFSMKGDHVALSKVYRMSETETILVFTNEMVAIIRDEGAQKMLNSLQAVLTSPTMDLTKKTIDLRFDNPVIR